MEQGIYGLIRFWTSPVLELIAKIDDLTPAPWGEIAFFVRLPTIIRVNREKPVPGFRNEAIVELAQDNILGAKFRVNVDLLQDRSVGVPAILREGKPSQVGE